MARPQSEDYDKRRQFILDKAADLFAHQGFHGASVGDLAAQCKISKSLIYHYFPSKETILFNVMESYTKDLLLTVKKAASGGETLSQTFQTTVLSLMENYKSAGSKHRVLLQELDKLSPPSRKIIVENEDHIKNIIKTMIEKMNSIEERSASQNTALTMLFMGMLNWTHTWFDPKGKINSAALAMLAAEVFEKGVRALKS